MSLHNKCYGRYTSIWTITKLCNGLQQTAVTMNNDEVNPLCWYKIWQWSNDVHSSKHKNGLETQYSCLLQCDHVTGWETIILSSSSRLKFFFDCLTLKMNTLHTFETPGITCLVTNSHIPQDLNLKQFYWEPQSCIFMRLLFIKPAFIFQAVTNRTNRCHQNRHFWAFTSLPFWMTSILQFEWKNTNQVNNEQYQQNSRPFIKNRVKH